jgi:pyruvate formate lyase activating enzyme
MIPLYSSNNQKVKCLLCPHYCNIAEGKTGICGVRKNIAGKIELTSYGAISGYAPDPVEKKPLYHFYPGKNILSVGSYGCNMRCDFCQNYNISQEIPSLPIQVTAPEKIIKDALSSPNNIGIAFTYNEPVIWFEYMRDIAIASKEKGLLNVVVSNGYVNSGPLQEIISFTDAFNIDLKAFSNEFYQRLTGSEIEPVKNTLKQIVESGKHLEITNLVIPGQNDKESEMSLMSEWIAKELGPYVPLHLSRYYPMYKRNDEATSQEKLIRLHRIASKYLSNVYLGNIRSETGQNTYCHECGIIVTQRTGYQVDFKNLNNIGECTKCGTMAYKYFSISSKKSG